MENKLVPVWDMMKLLMENPKRRARLKDGSSTYEIRYYPSGYFSCHKEYFDFKCHQLTDVWEIIEPPKKLKEMNWGEVFYTSHDTTSINYCDIVSCVTGCDATRSWGDITKEEYLGLWTVSGVYEDD